MFDLQKARWTTKAIYMMRKNCRKTINMEGSTSTQPYITRDESTERICYFLGTDRAGGKGQLDIYSSLLDDKYGFAQPINLAINSEMKFHHFSMQTTKY